MDETGFRLNLTSDLTSALDLGGLECLGLSGGGYTQEAVSSADYDFLRHLWL